MHGFLLHALRELAIRQTASRWAFAGSSPKCLAAALSEAFAASDQRHCSATLNALLDWADRSATQQRVWQGSEGFTLQFVGSALALQLLQAHPALAGWLACARLEAAPDCEQRASWLSRSELSGDGRAPALSPAAVGPMRRAVAPPTTTPAWALSHPCLLSLCSRDVTPSATALSP